jgi:hypothetical protein
MDLAIPLCNWLVLTSNIVIGINGIKHSFKLTLSKNKLECMSKVSFQASLIFVIKSESLRNP